MITERAFKVVTADRRKKIAVVSPPLVQELIQRACDKLQLDSRARKTGRLVLASDGTEIDEDRLLLMLASPFERFMLLTGDEEWTAAAGEEAENEKAASARQTAMQVSISDSELALRAREVELELEMVKLQCRNAANQRSFYVVGCGAVAAVAAVVAAAPVVAAATVTAVAVSGGVAIVGGTVAFIKTSPSASDASASETQSLWPKSKNA